MKRVYVDYLRDMLDNAERAIEFVHGINYEAFAKDDKSVYAVIRAVEIIGEAARKIPKEVCDRYPEIPWRDVAAMRNKLLHEYFGINMQVVWQTIQDDLPMLVSTLQRVLEREKDEG